MTNFVKKLSVREMLGSAIEIKKLALSLTADGDSVTLFRIVGLVSNVRRVETQYGESYGMRGEFVATLIKGGERFASMEVFLPDFATQLVMGALNAAKLSSGNKDVTVEIALDIGVKRVDKLAIGYEYTVTPVTPLQTSSPLEKLLATAEAAKPLAIAAPAPKTDEAPKAEAPKADETKPEPKKNGGKGK